MADTVVTQPVEATELFERHRETLERALVAISERGYWSPYPEHPKAYGETAAAGGQAAFSALLGSPFSLEQPGAGGLVGGGDRRTGSSSGLPTVARSPTRS